MTSRWLDLDAWPRREHYELFRHYEQPFFNVCAEVDVTRLVQASRAAGGPSFFVASFHASLRALNEVEEFHYRIREGGVLVHDVVHGGSTVLRPDGTFAFAYFDYTPDFERFERHAEEVLRAAGQTGVPIDPQDERDDLIHYSVLPWISFTSFAHARRASALDSTPKIVFGRYSQEGASIRMPVSVEVHHALMDGLHVGRFLDGFQERLQGFEPGAGEGAG